MFQEIKFGFSSRRIVKAVIFLMTVLLSANSLATVYFSEVVKSNGHVLSDSDGDFRDWVEIHNSSTDEIHLEGWALESDDEIWAFPQVELASDERILVWLSGKDRTDLKDDLHASFRLGRSGEKVYLLHPDGTKVDEVPSVFVPRDFSLGRNASTGDDWQYYKTPNPMNEPMNGRPCIADAPEIFPKNTTFRDEIQVSIKHDAGAFVVFTTDGSAPQQKGDDNSEEAAQNLLDYSLSRPGTIDLSTNSAIYKDPFIIAEGEKTDRFSGIATTNHISVGPNIRNNILVVRARAFHDKCWPSEVVSRTYIPQNEFDGLPIFSLMASSEDLFGASQGILVPGLSSDLEKRTGAFNYLRRGADYERPASMQLFSASGDMLLDATGGVRVQGGVSRHYSMKAIRLYPRNIDSLSNEIEFADDEEAEPRYFSFDPSERLLLRNGGQPDYQVNLYRSGLISNLTNGLGFEKSGFMQVALYLNGEFWGISNLRNRIDERFLAARKGLPRNNIKMYKSEDVLEILESEGVVPQLRKPDDFRKFLTDVLSLRYQDYLPDYINSIIEEYSHMTSEAFLDGDGVDRFSQKYDIDNFLAYLAVMTYVDDKDWRLSSNQWLWWLANDSGQVKDYRAVLWDVDAGLNLPASLSGPSQQHGDIIDAISHLMEHDFIVTSDNAPMIWVRLLAHDHLKRLYARYLLDLTNGAFNFERASGEADRLENNIKPYRDAHVSRWPDSLMAYDNVRIVDFFRERNGTVEQFVSELLDDELYTVKICVDDSQSSSIKIRYLEFDATFRAEVDSSSGCWYGKFPAGHTLNAMANHAPASDNAIAHWDVKGHITKSNHFSTVLDENNKIITVSFSQDTL